MHVPFPGRVTPQIFIHSHSYCRFISGASTQQQTSLADITRWVGLHLQFFIFVLMYLFINDPAQRGDAQLRHHLARLVCCNVPNDSTICSQPCRNHHCPYWARTSVGLSSQCASRRFLNVFTVLLLISSQGIAFQVVVILMGNKCCATA